MFDINNFHLTVDHKDLVSFKKYHGIKVLERSASLLIILPVYL